MRETMYFYLFEKFVFFIDVLLLGLSNNLTPEVLFWAHNGIMLLQAIGRISFYSLILHITPHSKTGSVQPASSTEPKFYVLSPQYLEPRGPSFLEPRRPRSLEPQRPSSPEPQRPPKFLEPRRPPKFLEHRRSSKFLEPQRPSNLLESRRPSIAKHSKSILHQQQLSTEGEISVRGCKRKFTSSSKNHFLGQPGPSKTSTGLPSVEC